MPPCPRCGRTVITIKPHPEFAARHRSPVKVDIQPHPNGYLLVLGREHHHMFAHLEGEDLANARLAELPLFVEHRCMLW